MAGVSALRSERQIGRAKTSAQPGENRTFILSKGFHKKAGIAVSKRTGIIRSIPAMPSARIPKDRAARPKPIEKTALSCADKAPFLNPIKKSSLFPAPPQIQRIAAKRKRAVMFYKSLRLWEESQARSTPP